MSHTFQQKKGGTGLGLYVVENIVKNHQGHIEVISEKGKGTEFVLYLPAKREITVEPKKDNPDTSLEGINILLMDDEEMFREVIKELVPIVGGTVTVVSNGNEAISIYKEALNKKKGF